MKEAKQARWAVAGGLAVLAVGMVVLGMTGWVQFVQAEDAGSPLCIRRRRSRRSGLVSEVPAGRASAPTPISRPRGTAKRAREFSGRRRCLCTGHNSPVVWEDRIFLSGADPNVRQVFCFDGKSGRLLWTGDVPTVPLPAGEKLEIMEDTGYAACTVATDGRRVYAIFPTGDVAGFDFNGRRLWHKSLGRARQFLWLRVLAGDL